MSIETLRTDLASRQLADRQAYDYQDCAKTKWNSSPTVPVEMAYMHTKIPWCRLVTTILEERLDVKEIKSPDEDLKTYLRQIWKSNSLDDKASRMSTDALVAGRSYFVVSPNGDGDPYIEVVPSYQMVHRLDVYTGRVVEALRAYGPLLDRFAYYTPGKIEYLVPSGGGWKTDPEAPTASIPTADERVPVFPFLNRPSVSDRWGRPEAKDIWSLQDAATRTATELSVASSLMAVPQRVLSGITEEDLTNSNGELIDKETLFMSRILTVADPAAGVAQFQAAQLQNFTTELNALGRNAASIMGISTSTFGITSDANPTSGDSQEKADNRLVHRVERIGRGFEASWIDMLSYIATVYGGFDDVQLDIEYVDPSTPTWQSRADAAVKLAAAVVQPNSLYTRRALLKRIGETDETIDEMDDEEQITQLAKSIDGGIDAESQSAPEAGVSVPSAVSDPA